MPREIIWMRPESSGIGRRAEHSRAEITAAAVAVADADGLAAVTMRRVAARIGTGAASLYRYVDHRADLIDLMIDSAYAEIELRRTGDGWRSDLVAVARGAIRVTARHPWLSEAINERVTPAGPHVARLLEHCLGALAEHPAPGARKLEALAVMGATMWQYAGVQARGTFSELLAANAAYLAHVAADGGHPHLAAALAGLPPAAPRSEADDLLARTLVVLLEGLLGEG